MKLHEIHLKHYRARAWVKCGPSPYYSVRILPVDSPQVCSPHFTNALRIVYSLVCYTE